jgi:histidinol-phosphate/aromatic aminotransferase/cobyric acid decarboxylase-like protein
VLRGMAAYGLADCLRLTIGTEEENVRFLAALKDFVQA